MPTRPAGYAGAYFGRAFQVSTQLQTHRALPLPATDASRSLVAALPPTVRHRLALTYVKVLETADIINIGKLGISRPSVEYYIGHVASGAEDYYTGVGEAP